MSFLLALIDAVLISASWFGAYFTRRALNDVFGYSINELTPYIKGVPLIVGAWLLINLSLGLYRRRKRTMTEELRGVLNLSFLGALVSMSLGFLFRELQFGRSVILLFAVYSFVVLSISRYAIAAGKEKHVLIFGSGTLALRLLQKLQDHPEPYNVVGFLSEEAQDVGKDINGHKVLGTLSSLRDVVHKFKPDEIIVASRELHLDAVMDTIMRYEDLPVKFRAIVKGFDALSYGMGVEFIGDLPIVEFGLGHTSPLYDITKRIFDITLATFVTIITFPIWILSAILIKLDSKGPVFFAQERVGYKGKKFKIIKFRTMYQDVPKYALSPRDPTDPRITRVGKFLRRWSIDELPQMINVLKGDMSFVGPRPEMPQIVEQYKPWQRKRLDVRPGLTGLWQILGRKELPLESNLQYDFVYLRNRSFAFDLTMVMKTIPALLRKKGSF
jgi:exopolysaccharide biosynthesis polyprenyl glycosylphosphotransferase